MGILFVCLPSERKLKKEQTQGIIKAKAPSQIFKFLAKAELVLFGLFPSELTITPLISESKLLRNRACRLSFSARSILPKLISLLRTTAFLNLCSCGKSEMLEKTKPHGCFSSFANLLVYQARQVLYQVPDFEVTKG